MGVLACDRKGCENVMCDHYSSFHGYICNVCLVELKAKVPNISVEEFMATKKGGSSIYSHMSEAALAYIDSEFEKYGGNDL